MPLTAIMLLVNYDRRKILYCFIQLDFPRQFKGGNISHDVFL